MKGLNMKKSENKRQPIQARKRAFAFLNNKSGEGYVDVAVTVMIVAFVLVFSVNVVSLVALNQNIKTAADQLTDYAAMKGTVSVDEYARELKEKIGVDFSYSFDGSETLDSTGKVQLGDRIICTVTYQLRMPGFGDFILPISLKASSSGLSQVYWK